MKIKKSIGDIIADILIYIFIGVLSLICLIPFLHVAAKSISSDAAVYANKVFLWPVGLTLNAYKTVMGDPSMMRSLWFTVFLTVAFTVIGLIVTIFSAYPLTKRDLKGRSFFVTVFMITMYFSAGTIPDFLNMDNLGMLDTVWCLLLPLTYSAYNMIILKTFMQSSIPDSLLEAAELDGCDHFKTLFAVVLPLSKSVLATLALFYAVSRWNAFTDALYYIQNPDLQPLQLKLYNLIDSSASASLAQEAGGGVQQAAEVVKSATIMFATIPIIIVYPFVQKYFVKGVMVGAVKG